MEKSISNTILEAYRLLETIHKNDDIRINKWEVPFLREVSLFDFSLVLKGDQEDRLYIKDSFLRNNVRRGNTIIQIVDNETNELKTTFLARKGLKKFFDIREEYLEKEFSDDKVDKTSIFTVSEHFKLSKLIFQSLRDSLSEGHEIEVFKLLKANGENCQIAWIESTQTWLIASKNVSLLARTPDDIQEYGKDRFHYAKLIAKAWFDILEKISKKGADISSLKNFLKKHTMIGEYVGNPSCQHLVQYREIDILFFAIVNNQIEEECLPPLESFKFFSKFHLSTVRLEDLGTFKTLDSLNQALRLVYAKITTADIELEQEGSVLYFYNTTNKKVMSLGKIKTLEYRIFRKLREKLRNFVQYYDKLKFEPFQSFYNEVEELCRKHFPPRPLDFYYKICQFSIDFIDEYPRDAHEIHTKFLTFLSNVLYCIDNQIPLTPKDLDRDLNPNKSIFSYAPETVLKYKFKNSSKSYIKGHYLPDKTPFNNSSTEKRRLYVIVPIMIPGSGKSFLLPFLHEAAIRRGAALEAVCADQIRRECMNVLSQKQPSLSEEKLFEQTGKLSTLKLTKAMEEKIKNLLNSNKENNFLFIDKNHCPGTFEKVIDNIQKIGKDFDLQIIALYPEANGVWGRYPFSLNYFMNCIYRVQNRTEHDTLRGNRDKSMNVMFMYMQLFRDAKLTEAELRRKGFDKALSIDLTMEKTEAKFDKKLLGLIQKALEKTEVKKKCGDFELVKEISREFEKTNGDFPILKKQYLSDISKELIKDILTEKASDDHEKSLKRKGSKDLKEIIKETKETYIEEEKTGTSEYNPRQIPSMLGIFAIEPNRSKQEVLQVIRANLSFLKNNFPEDTFITQNLNSLTKNFGFPRTFHVLSLAINGEISKTETKAFRTFREGVRIRLDFPAIVYIPDMIIAGLYFPKSDFPVFEINYPHMVLMISDKTSPEFAYKAISSLFETSLKSNYEQRSFLQEKMFCVKADVVIERKKYLVYLSKVEIGIGMDGETAGSVDLRNSGK